MAIEIFFENTKVASVDAELPHADYSYLKWVVANITNVPESDLYATQNGRTLESGVLGTAPVRFVSRLRGGKGGFGSMLRAIGAQIEKTTNREACRDLSGRRLRDIREEQRLREWAASEPQRTEDAARRKKDRLKRLCAIPSHEFQDPAYEEARRRLEEEGGAAVEAGVQATPASSLPAHSKLKKRKPNLWIEEDLSDLSSSESGCEDEGSAESGSVGEPDSSNSGASGKRKGLGKRSHSEISASSQKSTCTATSTQSKADTVAETQSKAENAIETKSSADPATKIQSSADTVTETQSEADTTTEALTNVSDTESSTSTQTASDSKIVMAGIDSGNESDITAK